jgi:hypothetical protein
MKTYKKLETINAKIFESGDEDGMSCIPFVSICKWKNKEGKYKDCKNCTLDIKKQPYINILNDKWFGEWESNYLCIDTNGNRSLVDKNVFEHTYEEVR